VVVKGQRALPSSTVTTLAVTRYSQWSSVGVVGVVAAVAAAIVRYSSPTFQQVRREENQSEIQSL